MTIGRNRVIVMNRWKSYPLKMIAAYGEPYIEQKEDSEIYRKGRYIALKKTLDWNAYVDAARRANAEGCVLLENRNQILPLAKGTKVSIFGRIQDHYYKSGTGSGGMVNVAKVYSIPDGIRENGDLIINEALHAIYETWEETHPYDEGIGWGEEPWSQSEMELTEDIVRDAAADSDAAIVIIGRTAGEDKDASDTPGSYQLTEMEQDMLRKVRDGFSRMIVLLNVGAIIDMSWMDEVSADAVMYVWQGGMVGGLAVADLLTGRQTPSGRLTDTIAYHIEDYPSDADFGGEAYNCYTEDIYVGYRYFETFAKEKVRYPFGYGLSYTKFEVICTDARREGIDDVREDADRTRVGKSGDVSEAGLDGLADKATGKTVITIDVKNTGSYAGKEVVQIYGCAPQGVLGKPSRVLLAYSKTELLKPDETETMVFEIRDDQLASYDDSGATGHKSCFVLEAGSYAIYAGTNVRSAEEVVSFDLEDLIVVKQYREALAPVLAYKRIKPEIGEDGRLVLHETSSLTEEACDMDETGDSKTREEYHNATIAWEDVPLATILPEERRNQEIPEEILQQIVSDEVLGLEITASAGIHSVGADDIPESAGDMEEGIRNRGYIILQDVINGQASLTEFIAQLSDEDLSCIIRGEGMGSSLVTPGTASAFGGVSKRLRAFGIPAVCCDDGPSGMRLDSGAKAFSLPNGTLIGCSYHPDMVEELYSYLGLEMISNKVDNLLGPGMNIHRHPLNGRNFEYFSEDPYLTGTIGMAQVRGLQSAGVTGTIKHFAGNNQEYHRRSYNSVISERALREIYLRGFEMVVTSGVADSIMTTYGALNGLFTSGQYDLNTAILREEWGYDGIVMSDWWADINERNQPKNKTNFAAMVRAQNDLYMVCPDGSKNVNGDNTLEALAEDKVTRAELQRSAMNICRFAMHTEAMRRQMGEPTEVEIVNRPKYDDDFDMEDVEFVALTDPMTIDLTYQESKANTNYVMAFDNQKPGIYEMTVVGSSPLTELAQIPCTLFYTGIPIASYTFHGTEGADMEITQDVRFMNRFVVLRLFVGKNGVNLKEIRLRYKDQLPDRYTGEM